MRIKELKRVIIFVSILIVLLVKAGQILQPKWCYGYPGDAIGYRDMMSDFYSQERGTIDVLFLGASHSVHSFLPIELYQNYGVTSYNLGSSSQFLESSYFLLEEALRYQQPQYVVLDVGQLTCEAREGSSWEFSCNYKILSSIKDLVLRYKSLYAIKPEENSMFEWSIPILKFHDRWKELEAKDFQRDFLDEYPDYLFGSIVWDGISPWYGYKNGVMEVDVTYSDSYVKLFYDEDDRLKEEKLKKKHTSFISPSSAQYLVKILDLCKDNNVTLLGVKGPTAASWSEEEYLKVGEYLKKQGIDYIDFNFDDTGIIFDWNTDTLDGGLHANYSGGLKATNYIGNYLMEKGNMINHRGDEKYFRWESALKEYRLVKNSITSTGSEKAYKWLDELIGNSSEKIVIISVQDDMSDGWNEEYGKRMEQLGLTGDLSGNYRCSYLALIDDGKVEFEKFGNELLVHKATFQDGSNCVHQLEVISAGMKQGNYCNIYIDEVDYAYHAKGLNVVVYDKNTGEVISSVAIDTFGDGYFYDGSIT